jgi:hypothetical protein
LYQIIAYPTPTVTPSPSPSPVPTPTVTPSPTPTPPPPPPSAARPTRCVVPNVKGKTVPAARARLRAQRCALGRVKRAYSNKVKMNRIISQSRSAGRRLPTRTKVHLVVSRGRLAP